MKLSIIIPTKDRGMIFLNTLQHAISAIQEMNAEVIVVNDGAKPITIDDKFPGYVQVVRNKNAGVASARNFGATLATGDLFLFLDDDIVINRNAIDGIFELHQEHPEAAITLPRKYPETLLKEARQLPFGRFLIKNNLTSIKDELGPAWVDNAVFEVEVAASFCLFMSRNTFERSGGYDESFPFAGFEDYDFSRKLKDAGIVTLQSSNYFVEDNESDRIYLSAWMKREYQGAQTRAWGVLKGYPELKITYPHWKRIAWSALSRIKLLLAVMAGALPNHKFFDPAYFRLVHLLIGIHIFDGYQKVMKQNAK